MCVTANSEGGEPAEAFQVKITVHPIDLTAGGLFHDAKWALCRIRIGLVNDTKVHDRTASSSAWNWWASPPCTKKLLGSWPSGNETSRALRPRCCSVCERCWAA